MADTAVLLEKIARYKDYLESETDEVLKEKYKGMVEKFEKQLAEVEQKVEKEEEKLEKKEEKAMDEVSEKLKKYTEMMNDSDDEDVKAMYKKKIEKLKSQIGEVKEQIKEEKKELQEKKDELKEAVKEVKEAEKSVRKVAIKKVQKTEKDRKEITKAKKERRRRLTSILTDLNRLVEETPSLRAKYEGEGVDLKRDAGRGSKPFGWRFKGKNNFKKPRPDQHGQPNVYYEGRANRADVKRKGNIKLEDGGTIQDVYGSGFYMERTGKYRVYGQPNPEIFGYFENMYDFQKWVESTFITEGVEFDSEYSSISMEGDKEDLDRLLNEMIQEAIQRKPGADEDNFDEGFPDVPRPRFAKGGTTRGGMFEVGDLVMVDDSGYVKLFSGFDLSEPALIISKDKAKSGGKVVYFYGIQLGDGRKPFNKAPESKLMKVEMADGGMMADGGRIKVGTFDEAQLKNREDKKAVEKAMKDTGMKYVDTKMVKKGGKMFLEVYLIPDDEYQKSSKFAEGGEIKVGDKVRYKNAKYSARVIEVVDDVEIPYAIIDYENGGKAKKAYLEDLQKVHLAVAEEYVNPDLYKMAEGGEMTQGYDDREDESLAMRRGKTASKELDGTKKEKEKSRRDDAGFETRKKKWAWKPEAIEKRLIPFWKSAAKKTPSKYYRRKYPNLVEKI